MDNPNILDSLFRKAVSAIDAGDVSAMESARSFAKKEIKNDRGT